MYANTSITSITTTKIFFKIILYTQKYVHTRMWVFLEHKVLSARLPKMCLEFYFARKSEDLRFESR